MELPIKRPERVKLTEINPYLTCYLCKGYLIDATTISECLHSFCRSCIIKFLQDNSYCPVCEMIINKAKPNLKLDKTLQDIVYKLVPELFLKEMTRRKLFYQQYPQIAARLTPEERGEDTERTIFNPQDCISLSMEYVSDDSAPGAIRLPDPKNGLDTNLQLTAEDNQTLMKRYLQCPGMCRVEVLKKFVRNKYNVDTNLFYIDILYKKVPLPDHYTLIDIAYIYSWKRNEPMKFFFRITDINKINERFDIFTSQGSFECVVKPPLRTSRACSDRTNTKRKESAGSRKGHRITKHVEQENVSICDQNSSEYSEKNGSVTDNKCDNSIDSKADIVKTDSDKCERTIINDNKENENNRDSSKVTEKEKDREKAPTEIHTPESQTKDTVIKNKDAAYVLKNSDNINGYFKINSSSSEIVTSATEQSNETNINSDKKSTIIPHDSFGSSSNESSQKLSLVKRSTTVQNGVNHNTHLSNSEESKLALLKEKPVPDTKLCPMNNKPEKGKQKASKVKQKSENTNSKILLKPEITQQMKDKIQSEIQGDSNNFKNSVYTNITLNRTNNVEIITKIQKVSNKDGQPIGLKVINQTVKKGSGNFSAPNSVPAPGPSTENKPTTYTITVPSTNDNKIKICQVPVSNPTPVPSNATTTTSDSGSEASKIGSIPSNLEISPNNQCEIILSSSKLEEEQEKRRFLQSIELTAINPLQLDSTAPIEKHPVKNTANVQKRKSSSPVKNDKSKKLKVDKKPSKRIIIQPKLGTNLQVSNTTLPLAPTIPSNGLQSLIENCKIPSSLSITIKESSTDNRLPSLPPVKNYIEILKIPDENTSLCSMKDSNSSTKLEFNLKLCDNDSEQKVDQDLAEIARSLTEKIPLSTTISQIVGPKPQFSIPTKAMIPSKINAPLPSVPDISKILSVPKDKKLHPRSPQTFQKIFEESIKKPDGTSTNKAEEKDQKNALDLSNDTCQLNNKRNILEIASQLYKKTKLEQEKNQVETKIEEVKTSSLPKVPIPRLSNQRNVKPPQKSVKYEMNDSLKFPQTLSNMHSNALGLNYSISVASNTIQKINGTVQVPKEERRENLAKYANATYSNNNKSETKQIPIPNSFSLPKETSVSPSKPNSIPRNMSPSVCNQSPRNSPKHSPKSSPIVKHMYAPTPNLLMDPLRVNTYIQKVPSPKQNDLKPSPTKLSPVPSGKVPSPAPNQTNLLQKHSPGLNNLSPKPMSPLLSPKPSTSSKPSPTSSSECPSPIKTPKSSTCPGSSQVSPLSPNEILEKYNIQNLAQLTASLNFNAAAAAGFGINPNNQLGFGLNPTTQMAMMIKHLGMQNMQNWLNMNQGPLLQYEKYLQSLKTNQNHLLGNIKEN